MFRFETLVDRSDPKFLTFLQSDSKITTYFVETFFDFPFLTFRREALKAAVSEKDAHLALLELSGLKTTIQIEQAENLKAERKMLMEKLKEEVNVI